MVNASLRREKKNGNDDDGGKTKNGAEERTTGEGVQSADRGRLFPGSGLGFVPEDEGRSEGKSSLGVCC